MFVPFGFQLFQYCRGIDNRKVEANRVRKSLSVETTFNKDIKIAEDILKILGNLYCELQKRLEQLPTESMIKNLYIKIKFSNFKLVSLERSQTTLSLEVFKTLIFEVSSKHQMSIRLIGIGVHFKDQDHNQMRQITLAL